MKVGTSLETDGRVSIGRGRNCCGERQREERCREVELELRRNERAVVGGSWPFGALAFLYRGI